jgi:hypothetical protein
MNIFPHISALGIACLVSFNLNAESSHSSHDHGHNHGPTHRETQQEVHLHGYAALTLAHEGSTLEINFESPAVNIVGFEHKHISDEQLQVINKAKKIFESPTELFTFSGVNCSLTQMNANFSDLLKDQRHKENEHHSGSHNAPTESHSEITANYKYDCPQGEKLNTITVNLITRFPGINKIKAMWLTDNRQGAVELTPNSNLIQIR